MKIVLIPLVRAVAILAIIILVRSLINGQITYGWRDLIIAAIVILASAIQSYFEKKKQVKMDELAEERKKNQSW